MVRHRFFGGVPGGERHLGGRMGASGTPVAVSRGNSLPIFNGGTRPFITSYDNWRPATKGDKFDPQVDRFLDRSAFPAAQPSILWGNETRDNPRIRTFGSFNENVSLAKTFRIRESFRADFRLESFNVLNRHAFGTGSTSLDGNTFGLVTSASGSRESQIALKIYW